MANGVIKKGGSLPCPVDASGLFTDEVTDFKNQYVKVFNHNFFIFNRLFIF